MQQIYVELLKPLIMSVQGDEANTFRSYEKTFDAGCCFWTQKVHTRHVTLMIPVGTKVYYPDVFKDDIRETTPTKFLASTEF